MSFTVRLRSANGQFRLQIDANATCEQLYNQAADVLKTANFTISNQPTGKRPFGNSNSYTLTQMGIKHGDMLFVTSTEVKSVQDLPTAQVPSQEEEKKLEDDDENEHSVDRLLSRQDGLIKRGKDARFCRHGDKGMCDYCMPLEPYDAKYLEQEKIKHLSFHAYLRKLQAGSAQQNAANRTANSQGKFENKSTVALLDEPQLTVNQHCDAGHAPYPQAMCAKCQLSAIVLQQ